jgi:apolipoprotein N-acyltransferase
MRILWNVLLGLAAAACALALLFQGFAFTAMSPQLMLWLKILGTLCCQWFFLRVTKKKLLQLVPVMASGLVAVWGFFLYLTSPSWLHATFSHFVRDYALYLLVCLGFLLLRWLLPRIWRIIRKAIRNYRRQKKEVTPPPQGYAKKKKTNKGAKR